MNNSIKHVVVDMEKYQPIKSATDLSEKRLKCEKLIGTEDRCKTMTIVNSPLDQARN